MEKDLHYWREQTLEFLLNLGVLDENSNIEQVRKEAIHSLHSYSGADHIYVIKKIDNVTEQILISSDLHVEGNFTDTAFLSKEASEAIFTHFKEVNVPSRFHLLCNCKSVVYIRLTEENFKGAIVLGWSDTCLLTQGFSFFLTASIPRLKEMSKLNFLYLSLEQLKVRFNAIFQTVSAGLIFLDEDGESTWLNPQAKTMLNILNEDSEITPSMVSEKMKKLRESALNSAEIQQQATDWFHSGEEEIRNWTWRFKKQIYNVSKTTTVSMRIKGTLWMFEDITAMFTAHEQLQWYNNKLKVTNEETNTALAYVSTQNVQIAEQNKEIIAKNEKLKQINEEKNELIGVVSHDLRSPLLQIKGFAQIVEMDAELLSADQRFSLDKIKTISERGLHLIKDLLDISAMEQQIMTLKMESVDIEILLETEIATFRIAAAQKNIKILLLAEGSNHLIVADKQSVIRIFENLISNAIKFSHQNTVVQITIRKNEQAVIINVTDQGQGIPESDMIHLFGKFKRLSAKPTANETSSGLGLSIVKALVEQLNGQISCKSEWMQGTTFTVSFPAA